MRKLYFYSLIYLFLFFLSSPSAPAQDFQRRFPMTAGSLVEIKNFYGRVDVRAEEGIESEVVVSVAPVASLNDGEIKREAARGRIRIEVSPAEPQKRIDLTVKLPAGSRVKVETREGEVRVSGNLANAEVKTETGTIAADVPLENLQYNFVWTASRPRFMSERQLEEVKEKSAGRFVLKGKIVEETEKIQERDDAETASADELSENEPSGENKKTKTKDQKPKNVSLNFMTERGIVLLNVNPNEVPTNLRERPLTEAAKAIIRSGDSLLTQAIRRASPKYFGDYASTLPPHKREPIINEKPQTTNAVFSEVKRVLARVTDLNNRAVADLKSNDFEVLEAGKEREILSVEPTTAPFNLVLLLDVSGSVDNYIDFIRKTARDFVNTVSADDRVAIVIFNEDVKTISTFSLNKQKLSESLDTFDSGGATSYYDALAYVLTDTLEPIKGERTAIVVLSDGDDNRSFLPFESLLGTIQESGALVYPLYVPSGLIAASATRNPTQAIDPLRTRYLSLTSKAESEGEKLAQISGGVYFPISQLGQLKKAYEDIVTQLRTAYTITFRSDLAENRDGRASPRLRVRVKRENAFVKLGSVVEVKAGKTSRKELKNDFLPARFASSGNSSFFFELSDRLPPEIFHRVEAETAPDYAVNDFAASPRGLLVSAVKFNRKSARSGATRLSRFAQIPEISGEIEKINYKISLNDDLRSFKLENFDVNQAPGAFVLDNGKEKIAVSRWISPKRTRSYPYERVYDTLAFAGKKAAIIPVVKDEGLGGERDFLQWDTISLLSLLNVHVILAYYDSAVKNPKRNDRITGQKLDHNYVVSRLKEVYNFTGTARQWNEREAKRLKAIFEKAKLSYQKISKETKTYLHDAAALDELINYSETPEKFIEFSRRKASKAQNRELKTIQPKEALASDTKGKITITNALFGKYFFTVDETKIEPQIVYLIEAKHSSRARLPSRGDIKDGLIKMMLYTNLKNVKAGAKNVGLRVMIRLTSMKLNGSINSSANDEDLDKFCVLNLLDSKNKDFLKRLFREASENNFTVVLEQDI